MPAALGGGRSTGVSGSLGIFVPMALALAAAMAYSLRWARLAKVSLSMAKTEGAEVTTLAASTPPSNTEKVERRDTAAAGAGADGEPLEVGALAVTLKGMRTTFCAVIPDI
eukprot:CAMPEP_0196581890 /NCGR_PEP_ID=MMETSP1081-20130531/36237_1 /TAXON_ID=36882 /ORGANISM="Pyramimonas amylifera, Strain CCMP720" /LENGTH=110 /DNA_ID=CAMNT_0041902283 /DNA_START=167 /DNA_END=499 /DNA_ORIENTATION=+